MIEVMNDGEPLTLECEINDGEAWEIVDGNGRVTPCSGILVLGVNDISETLVLRKPTSPRTPTEFSLYSAHPNPFNPVTTIRFSLPEASDVSLLVYNLRGKLVETLVDKKLSSGIHTVQWDGTGFSSGVYFVLLADGTYHLTKKIVLLK